jgi:hypothetical protein
MGRSSDYRWPKSVSIGNVLSVNGLGTVAPQRADLF